MPVDYGKTEVIAPAGAIVTREKMVAMMKGRFFEFRGALLELRESARAIVVEDDAGLELAESLRGRIRSTMNQIENRRKDVTNPLVEDKRAVDSFANNLKTDCAMIIKAIDDVTDPYILRKERERKKKEEEQRRQFEEARKKSLADAARDAEEAIKRAAAMAEGGEVAPEEKTPRTKANPFKQMTVVPEVVPTETKIQTSAGSAKVEVDRVPEVVNLAAVCGDPGFIQAREKWLTEQALIYARQCLKMGQENIPGVVFKDVPVVKRRSK